VDDTLIHADGQTAEMSKLICAVCDYTKAPKKVLMIHSNCRRDMAAFNYESCACASFDSSPSLATVLVDNPYSAPLSYIAALQIHL
jgi:hypothetical protein